MIFRHCPRCQRHSLFQNGAFWSCGTCSYAITHKALLVDETRANTDRVTPFDACAYDRVKEAQL